MKIELKKFKSHHELSDETNAFSADVWVNGVKRGTARNTGTGGETEVYPHSLYIEIDDFAKTLPPHVSTEGGAESWSLNMDGLLLIDLMVEDLLKAKEDARVRKMFDKDLATRIMNRRDGKLFQTKRVSPETLATWLPQAVEKYGAENVLNAMDKEAAWAIWYGIVVQKVEVAA